MHRLSLLYLILWHKLTWLPSNTIIHHPIGKTPHEIIWNMENTHFVLHDLNPILSIWKTVEPSMFIGDQCLCISWVTLTHEYTPLQIRYKDMHCLKCAWNRTSHTQNYVSTNKSYRLSMNIDPQQIKMMP